MKKTLAIICALLSLAACNKVTPIEEEPSQEASQEFKVNISFSRSNISDDTKASVKTGFATDDVVFIFFNGVGDSTNPKYLEMKYNGSTWVPTQKNDLGASDLSGAGTKELTAVYLPYGSSYEVAYDGGFTIKDASGNDYSGHFFSGHVEYEFTDNTLRATISLSAVPSDTAGDKLVHFDVSGFASDHTYAMYQEYMKPISLTKIAANGDVSKQVGTMGDAIPGYQDASFMSFSGVLDNSAVNEDDVDFWFSIRDTFDGMLYYRDAGTRKIIEDMYIGLGSRASKWSISTPGDFTVSAGGDKITIARSNLSYLGATGGSHPWQLMKYPWTVIETNAVSPFIPSSSVDFGLFGWATSGYNGNNPWNYGSDATVFGPSLSDSASEEDRIAWYNKYGNKEWYIVEPETTNWDWAKYNTIYQYGGATSVGDGWRTPTRNEFDYILFTRTDDYRCARATVGGRPGIILFPDGFVLPSGITVNHLNPTHNQLEATYAENTYTNLQWNILEVKGSVFFPAGGYRNGSNNNIVNFNSYGGYSTSTIGDRKYRYVFTFDHQGKTNATFVVQGVLRYHGMSVRLVRDL